MTSKDGSKYTRMMDPPPAYSEMDPNPHGKPGNNSPPSSGAGGDHVNVNVNSGYPNYGATIVDQPVTVPVTQVILIGGCPACRVGILEDSYSLLGIICAIVFFPIGILCCLALKDKRCSNCGASF